MMATRGVRIFGAMMLFGLLAAVIAGGHACAGAATLGGILLGGFAGEAWDRARRAGKI